MGASAGGLDALQEFVEQLPADTGMALIVVTHQHPGHTSLLPELLGRKTKVTVVEAADATKIEPNHIYVSPPGEYLALRGGTLQLTHFEAKNAPQLPIDHFFRSLADDQQERAVCIVLSGTGTDGTIGLKAVKAESGMVMVQKPQTAKYAGMPSSAIGTGLADYVLPPSEMPQQLVAYAQGPYLQGAAAAAETPAVSTEAMQKILLQLRARSGHDFLGYYLEPAEGQPKMNLLEMAREGLQIELASAIRQAAADGQEVSRKDVRVKSNGEYSHVDLSVTRIADPEPIRGLLLVTFRPVAAPPETPPPKKASRPAKRDTDRVEQLEREVQYLTETHKSTLEELETANEELKSTNEELQSTNEELQSSNEELETSKEEMQSLNEELTTVNAELQSKVDELSHANDDMQNLLNSIDVATIFLDNELNIKRYTEPAKELIKLRQTDVGRPIAELATEIDHHQLIDDCREVLKTLVPKQRDVTRTDGTWYMMRILPYRTTRNVIDGLAITFVNIDELKQAKQTGARRTYFENLFDTVRHPLVVLDEQLRVESANRLFYQTFRRRPKETEGVLIYEVGDSEWDIPELRELLEEILPQNTTFEDFEVEHEFRKLGRKVFLLNARRVEQSADLPGMILLGLEDVTDKYGE